MENKQNNNRVFRILSLEVAIFVVVIVLLLGILNYFNIFSLSQIYPPLFGSLPHKEIVAESVNTIAEKAPITAAKELVLSCPVEEQYCDKGIPIYDNEEFLGLGFKLQFESNLYAAISGNIVFGGVQDLEKGILSHAQIIIGQVNTSGYSLVYDYFGLTSTQSANFNTINKGQKIGVMYGGFFPQEKPYVGINLLFSVKDKAGNNMVISTKDFVL